MAASLGTLGKLGIDTVSTVTKRFDYKSENLVMDEEMVDGNGVRGTRSRDVSRVRPGLQKIAGPISLQPNAVEMALLLEWIMGASPSGSPTVTYALADTLPSRYVVIDRVIKVHSYAGCKVDQAVFKCSQGDPLSLDLSVLALTESVGNAGTFPSLSIDTANGPWIFSDLVLTVNATALLVKECTINVNNFLDKDRYFNSLTLTSAETLDREVGFSCMVPYGDHQALYGASGSGGLSGTAVWTNGAAVLTMTFGKIVLPRKTPGTPGRKELMLPLEGIAYKTGATAELSVSLNPGP